MWSSSLRFIFMVPFLLIIVFFRGNLRTLFNDMYCRPWSWIGWSFVGFVLFYAPLTFSASFGPGWLIAGTWQITIIAGSVMVPFFYKVLETPKGLIKVRQKVPIIELLFSSIILIGVVLIQINQAKLLSIHIFLMSIFPVIVAAFAYPLGNRKMMIICDNKIDTFQRVLGMTLASLPFWIILSILGLIFNEVPKKSEIVQSLIVAISSGVIATLFFFLATDMVKDNSKKLAAVEATQSGEVIFSLLGEMILLGGGFPPLTSFIGLAFIILGMILHSLVPKTNESFNKSG